MKKEELKTLGLSDEQITAVFKINGLDIEGLKAELKEKETEAETVRAQLQTANKEIENFKGLDVEAIKQKADEYKTKFEEAEKQAKEEIDNLKFEYELESALKESKARNVKASKALLDLESLKNSKNRKEDLLKMIEAQKKENDYLYEPEEAKEEQKEQKQEEKPPMYTRPNAGTKQPEPPQDLGGALAGYYNKKK